MNTQTKELTDLKSESWKMFNAISRQYDLLNRILSFGLDISWRQELLKHLSAKPNQTILDVATGTADVVLTLLNNRRDIRLIYGVDMSTEMLRIGQAKIDQQEGLAIHTLLQRGDAQALSFMDDTFDTVTIAFGIRNVPLLMKTLMEMYRVLKPGGRLLILEFSLPKNFILRWGHLCYLRWVVPVVGFLFSGNYRAYRYLNQSIEHFPYGERFAKIITQVGFKDIVPHPLMGGIATIYAADK